MSKRAFTASAKNILNASIISSGSIAAMASTVALVIFLSACAQKTVTYVGLANENASFVKMVKPNGGSCGSVSVESSSQQRSLLKLDKRTFNEASICEGSLPKNTVKVQGDSEAIIIPQSLQKIVILGDTGCRLRYQDGKGIIQKCEDEKEWPFAQVMRSVEKENPELVVHLGDYHYREICADPQKCKPYEGTLGYGYKPWEADFLKPSERVLKKTPFIFVRGNHEGCQRAYEGFLKLLSPVGNDKCVDEQDTQYTSFGNFLIVNFDNNNVDDKPLDIKSNEFILLKERYKKMVETLNARPETEVWLFTHRPIWGLAPSRSENLTDKAPASVNPNMQALVHDLPLPKKVQMIFAGHIHAVQFAVGNHPPQMVVGESGTSLDNFSKEALKLLPKGYRVFPADYGYVVMDRKTSGAWTATIKSVDGETNFVCQINETGVPCSDIKK